VRCLDVLDVEAWRGLGGRADDFSPTCPSAGLDELGPGVVHGEYDAHGWPVGVATDNDVAAVFDQARELVEVDVIGQDRGRHPWIDEGQATGSAPGLHGRCLLVCGVVRCRSRGRYVVRVAGGSGGGFARDGHHGVTSLGSSSSTKARRSRVTGVVPPPSPPFQSAKGGLVDAGQLAERFLGEPEFQPPEPDHGTKPREVHTLSGEVIWCQRGSE
jgi:hypothetical protein